MTPTILNLISSSEPYQAKYFLIQEKVRLGRNIKVGGIIAGCLLRRLGR
jgi:hypothetical protein